MRRIKFVLTVLALCVPGLVAPSAGAQQGDPAIAAAQRAVAARPADPEASFRLARLAADRGEFGIAIAALERILILYPDLANIRLELGVLYLRTGAPALGETFIREALKSPDAPAEVRARAEELLATAERTARPTQLSFQIGAGLVHDSNANFGPPGTATIGGAPVTAGTGQADSSAWATAAFQLRHDPGFQAGHLLALDAGYFARRYDRQRGLDLDRMFVSAGVDLNLSRAFGRPAELILRAEASRLNRGGARYLQERGLAASLRYAHDPRTQVRIGINHFRQDFIPTAVFAANNERDGARTGLDLRITRALSDRDSLSFGVDTTRKTAQRGYEAFRDVGLSLDYERRIAPLAGDGAPWTVGLGLRASRRGHDAPDPRINPAAAQKDRVLGVVGRLAVPVSARASLSLEAGHTRQSSNYAVKEYGNTYFAIGLTGRF